jgi:deoxyribodipyrimidine photo-lyase
MLLPAPGPTPTGTPAHALVWFKRDLRLADHAPLAAAAASAQAVGLFIIEPEWLQSPEFDPQHAAFALASLAPLRAALAARGLPLLVRTGPACTVLAELRRTYRCTHLFSHEETGPGWTYDRDRAVAAWCRAHGVVWQEWPQTGVVRRLKTRSGWAARWAARMDARALPVPEGWRAPPTLPTAALPPSLPTLRSLGVHTPPRALPPAGEAAAQAELADFCAGRARGYRRALSSPLAAERGCSRLSAHLACGTLSMRQVHQASSAAIARAQAEGDRALAYGLAGFASRLRWHCHFMQKLEDEPAIEHRNFARSCDGLRPGDEGATMDAAAQARLAAWQEGRTGYPMVDACMRSLNATGWLNFRMRAMLVSFAAYHLWLHWRAPGLHLARQFLDFEAGIHWSQMQMQSGTTGINTLRIYSPAKQALDHDPDGVFVRRWVPEIGTAAYPAPIVDERAALRHAKETMYGLRRHPDAQAEADAVQQRHGSRKAGLPPQAGKPAAARKPRAPKAPVRDPDQGDLFA